MLSVTASFILFLSVCLRWLEFNQVASSFIGRWFKLEGSGVRGERLGSRFTVRQFVASHREPPTNQSINID
jgi:hypothetical protein